MPAQDRAFDARGILPDTGEDGEFLEGVGLPVWLEFADDQLMKLLEKIFSFLRALAFNTCRHHGGRGFRNGAAGTVESHILDDSLAVYDQINIEMVSAQRIVTFRPVRGRFDFTEITRITVMF